MFIVFIVAAAQGFLLLGGAVGAAVGFALYGLTRVIQTLLFRQRSAKATTSFSAVANLSSLGWCRAAERASTEREGGLSGLELPELANWDYDRWKRNLGLPRVGRKLK